MRSSVLAWLLAIGCYSPVPRAGAPCGPGEACPTPLACVAGVCVAEEMPRDAAAGVADAAPGDAEAVTDAASDAPRCPASYVPLGGSAHVYDVVAVTASWQDARDACATAGGYLAIPDDATEAAAIVGATAANTWVGISDLATEGQYVTVRGMAAVFLPWSAGEPNNDTSADVAGQDCVQLYSFAEADDHYCDRLNPFVCECDP